MVSVEQVTAFVNENVLHSQLYDTATEIVRNKAINQAEIMLRRYLDVYEVDEPVPTEDVAEQAIWLLKMDDTTQRAEMGATSISVDGISISFSEKDRTLAPAVLAKYGRRDSKKRRVGSYHVPRFDTARGLYDA